MKRWLQGMLLAGLDLLDPGHRLLGARIVEEATSRGIRIIAVARDLAESELEAERARVAEALAGWEANRAAIAERLAATIAWNWQQAKVAALVERGRDVVGNRKVRGRRMARGDD